MDIILSKGQRNVLTALKRTATNIDNKQISLSTGKNVNSALDNPQNFFKAQSLFFRSQNLNELLDGINQATFTLKQADNGINTISNLLDLAENNIDDALTELFQNTSTAIDVEELLANYALGNNVVSNGGFEDDSNGTGRNTIPPDWNVVGPGGGVLDSPPIRRSDGVRSYPVGGWSNQVGNTISQTISTNIGETYVLSFDAGVNFGGASRIGTLGVEVSSGTTQNLSEEIIDSGDDTGLEAHAFSFIATETTTTVSFELLDQVGGDIDFDLDNVRIQNVVGLENVLDKYKSRHSEIRNQINELAISSDYRGTNLLNNNNLKVDFNEHRTTSLEIQGMDATSLGLGVLEESFLSKDSVLSSLKDIKEAKQTLRGFSNSIKSDLDTLDTRKNFTNNAIQTLLSGANDLTAADTNEEGAELLTLQTRQQIQFETLANYTGNNILNIFS